MNRTRDPTEQDQRAGEDLVERIARAYRLVPEARMGESSDADPVACDRDGERAGPLRLRERVGGGGTGETCRDEFESARHQRSVADNAPLDE